VNFRFTDSTGGKSAGAFHSRNLALHVGDDPDTVALNRLELSNEIDRPIQFMDQIHGNNIEIISEVNQSSPTADAIITTNPAIALAVMVADCIPLLLSNEKSVAAVHVGRKGLVNEVTEKTIAAMSSIDSSPITAIIGPSICGRCYEVSEDVFTEVTTAFPHSRSKTPSGGFALNLASALISDLEKAGITVLDHSRCTVEEPSLYSYRRDGVTGRQVGLIWL
jgi:YfiH family protein